MVGDCSSCAHLLVSPNINFGQINTKLLPIKRYIKSVMTVQKYLKKKTFHWWRSRKGVCYWGISYFFPNVDAIIFQSTKTLNSANFSIMECYSVMQSLVNKIQQRIEDMFFGTASEETLNYLISTVACISTFRRILCYQKQILPIVFYREV
jgi:hypothetical protein